MVFIFINYDFFFGEASNKYLCQSDLQTVILRPIVVVFGLQVPKIVSLLTKIS